jgi:hypothetical protein
MKYVAEMGSGAIILHTKFHKDWFRHLKVNGGVHRHSIEIAKAHFHSFKIMKTV